MASGGCPQTPCFRDTPLYLDPLLQNLDLPLEVVSIEVISSYMVFSRLSEKNGGAVSLSEASTCDLS